MEQVTSIGGMPTTCPRYQSGFEHERELQTVAAARFVEELVGQRSMHVVLVGDFDADPEATTARFWCGRQSFSTGRRSRCLVDAGSRRGI